MKYSLLAILVTVVCLCGEILPEGRTLPRGWNPGMSAGTPTNYPIFCNVKVSIPGTNIVAVGDGTTDDTVALQTALNLSTNKSVVYIPTGTYKTTTELTLVQKEIIVRGDGPTNTLIKGHGTSGSIISWSGMSESRWIPVTNGITKGSTNITLDFENAPYETNDISLYDVGTWLVISQENDTNTYGILPVYMTRAMGQIAMVYSKSGRVLTLDRPINYNYSNLTEFTASVGLMSGNHAPEWWGVGPVTNAGLESLSVERMSADGTHNIVFSGLFNGFIRNVKSLKANKWHIRLDKCARITVSQVYCENGWSGGGDSSYGVGLYGRTTDCLVEDSIFNMLRHSMILEYGGSGNVFAYNYSINPVNENGTNTDYLMGDTITHGGIPYLNLWEGNVTATIRMDNVLGGSRWNTVFRSYVTRKGLPSTYVACFGVDVQRNNYSNSVVGSVFGAPPTNSDSGLYRFGSQQDDISDIDVICFSSTILHGNYDTVTNVVTWDSNISDHTLPNSYYLASKPTWWGSTTWPPIGPDLTPMVSMIPAQERFLGINNTTPTVMRVNKIYINRFIKQ